MNVSRCGEDVFHVTKGPEPGAKMPHKDAPYNSVNSKNTKLTALNDGDMPFVSVERTPKEDLVELRNERYDTGNDGENSFRTGDVNVTPARLCYEGGVPFLAVPLEDVKVDNQGLHFWA